MTYSFSDLPVTGKKTVNLTAVQLVASGTLAQEGIQVLANSGNTRDIWIGFGTGVTAGTSDSADGFPLAPAQTYFWRTRHVGNLNVISSASGQKAHFSYL